MGLSSWQSGLKGGSGHNIELPSGSLNSNLPNNQVLTYLIGTFGLAAVLAMFPELIPFVLADAAETAGAGAAIDIPSLLSSGYAPDTIDALLKGAINPADL